ncbi:hypothetical protein KPC83_04660 [Collinsella sp. zg1085]|uniref:RsmB/NOP family class I SAM-dependent RNA methyltransferase n=1 Tax=Collinsella sp. zg1085 TaxID=2844380 RepID=UPI001C0D85A9|nr:transcription antitermination factor NusB [Collinsella sp. zg1085]QWT17142.1 hypothetical protein KPC83_04660 [Collinsella sp. zg1085]
MTRVSPARRVALRALCQAEHDAVYVRELLGTKDYRLDDVRDAAFALRLALGVTATRGCLDEALNAHLMHPQKLSMRVRMALRIAAFELLYLDASPRVAVSQGVELVHTQARAAAGLANAVLHCVADARSDYLAPTDISDERERSYVAFARQAGMPHWLVKRFATAYGDEQLQAILAAALEAAPVSICCNPRALQSSHFQQLLQEVHASPVALHVHNEVDEAIEHSACEATKALPQLSYYVDEIAPLIRAGVFAQSDAVVSDVHAQAVALRALRAGSLLEIGAGRGTKSFVLTAYAAATGLERKHVALEISAQKAQLNQERLRQAGLGAGVEIVVGDALQLDKALASQDKAGSCPQRFDTVLVDAPCSGTGTMRRHPEIVWRVTPEALDESFPYVQLTMLQEASARVEVSGELIYATCSIMPQENSELVAAFLASQAGASFTLIDEVQTLPLLGLGDGHYCARMQRIGE